MAVLLQASEVFPVKMRAFSMPCGGACGLIVLLRRSVQARSGHRGQSAQGAQFGGKSCIAIHHNLRSLGLTRVTRTTANCTKAPA